MSPLAAGGSVVSLRSRRPRRRFTPLLAERLEDRTLLAVMTYELHLLPPGGTLSGPRITSVNVGESYDLAVTVRDLRPDGPPGIFASYLDIGYDSSKTQVRVETLQRISIGSFSPVNPHTSASGTFTLAFGGQTTAPIAYSSDTTVLASSIQNALSSLSSIGVGNVRVTAEAPIVINSYSIRLDVRFGGTFENQDVTSLTIPSKNLSGANITVEDRSDLVIGDAAAAFREAFRSAGHYQNALFAENLPNLINDVGAFAGVNWLNNNRLELVRAQLKATATGTVTFTPSVSDMIRPTHNTVAYARPGESSNVPPAEIELGAAAVLTINPPSSITANPDSATVAEDAAAALIDVLGNDSASPVGSTKEIVSVTQPTNGVAALTPAGITYAPAVNFFGTDTFTYVVRNGAAGPTSTATVTIAVTPVNDAPSLDAIADPAAIAEDAAAQTISLLGIAAGAGESQILTVTAVSNNPDLIPNPIVSAGAPPVSLTYTPAANRSGTATITVTVADDGGTEGGGINIISRTFTVNVTPVNDTPSFVKGADVSVVDAAGLQTIADWATAVTAGPPDESGQALTFEITHDNPLIFAAEPQIDETGKLTFAPKANMSGTATVSVRLRDNGGTDSGGSDASGLQTFTIEVTRPFPLQNTANPLNVDGAASVNEVGPFDAILVINHLNATGGGPIPEILEGGSSGPPYLDVNGNNIIAPSDAIIIINYLNTTPPTTTTAAAEGEQPLAAAIPLESALDAEDGNHSAASAQCSDEALLAMLSAELAGPAIRKRRAR